MLWCFIYKATKAQKAQRASSQIYCTRHWQQQQEEGVGRSWRGGEKERGQMIQYTPQTQTEKYENWQGKWWANKLAEQTGDTTETGFAMGLKRTRRERKKDREVSRMVLQWWRCLMQHGVTSALQQSWAKHWQANLSSVAWNELQCYNYNMCGYSVVAVRSTCFWVATINQYASFTLCKYLRTPI